MPRENPTSVSRPQYAGEAARNAPSVRQEVVADSVPTLRTGALEQTQHLNSMFQSFFAGLSSAEKTIADADLTAKLYEDRRENDTQQTEAVAKALRGELLTPQEEADWDYATPYKKAKAKIAAEQDAADFYETSVRPLDLSGLVGVQQLSTDHIKQRLKGASDPEYAAYYTTSFNAALQKPVAEQRQALYGQFRDQMVDSQDAAFNLDVKTDNVTPERFQQYITDLTAASGPEKANVARQHAIAKAFTFGAINGKREQILSVLQAPQPVTPQNPKGLSWAAQFPDAFEKAWKETKDLTGQKFAENRGKSLQDLRLDIADADTEVEPGVLGIQRAAKRLIEHRETYGGDDPKFREAEVAFHTAWDKAVKKDNAITGLRNAVVTGYADPDAVNKYGTQMLTAAFAQGGPPAAAKLALSWNMLPSDFVKSADAQIANVNRPDVASATVQQLLPLYRQNRSLFAGKLSDDADFIMRQAENDALVGKDILTSVHDSQQALEIAAKTGEKVKDLKPYDATQKGAKEAFMKSVDSAILDQVKGGARGDALSRAFDSGSVVIGEEVRQAVIEATKRNYLKYKAISPGDAQEKALKAAVENIGARTLALATADGDYVVVPDRTPDTAPKWKRVITPDGKVAYDPNDDLRSQTKALPWINGGEGVTLAEGQSTQSEGYFTAKDGMGNSILFTPGQTISWDRNKDTYDNSITASPDAPVKREKEVAQIKLNEDPEKAKFQLDALLEGTMFRAEPVLTPHGQTVWELEARAKPQEKVLEQLRQQREEEATGQIADKALNSHWLERASQNLHHAFEVENDDRNARYAAISSDKPIEIDGPTLRRHVDSVVSYLRDKGLVPQSTGATKQVPDDFKSSEEAYSWLTQQVDNMKKSIGNLPLESTDTPQSERYVTARRQFLEVNEGRRNEVYNDGKGIATVGIGFNLNEPSVVKSLKAHGVDVAGVRSGTVKMTDDQIDNVFDDLVINAEKIISDKIDVPLTSQQRLALVSMAYNSPSLIGPKLVKAINDKNWKAATYEIRENSNKGDIKGIKFRRDREAHYFSLGSGEDPSEQSQLSGT